MDEKVKKILLSLSYRMFNAVFAICILFFVGEFFKTSETSYIAVALSGLIWISLFEIGIPNLIVNRISANGITESYSTIRTGFVFLLILSIVMFFLCLLYSFYARSIYLTILACISIRLPTSIASRIYLGSGDIDKYYLINLISNVIAGVFLIISLYLFREPPLSLIVYASILSLGDLFSIVKLRSVNKPENSQIRLYNFPWRESLEYWVNQIIGLLLYQSIPFIILSFSNQNDSGSFSYISRFFIVFVAMHAIIFQNTWPLAAKIYKSRNTMEIWRLCLKNIGLTIAIYIPFYLSIKMLYSVGYFARHDIIISLSDFESISMLYLLISILQCVGFVLNGIGMQKHQTKSGILCIILVFALIVFSVDPNLNKIIVIFSVCYSFSLVYVLLQLNKTLGRIKNENAYP